MAIDVPAPEDERQRNEGQGNELVWDPGHPVLQVLNQRRADPESVPGHRSAGDTARVALLIEGGGMRGKLSAESLVQLVRVGYLDGVDDIYMVSSGTLNGLYAVASGAVTEVQPDGAVHKDPERLARAVENLERNVTIYEDALTSHHFINPARALVGGPVLDVDWALDTVVDGSRPLNWQRALDSPIRLHILVTPEDNELQAEAVDSFLDVFDLRDATRASCSADAQPFRGGAAQDGSLGLTHLAEHAIADGATHLVSLSAKTLLDNHGQPRQRHLGVNLAAVGMMKQDPRNGQWYVDNQAAGNDWRTQLHAQRLSPGTGPFALDVGPEANKLMIPDVRAKAIGEQGRLMRAKAAAVFLPEGAPSVVAASPVEPTVDRWRQVETVATTDRDFRPENPVVNAVNSALERRIEAGAEPPTGQPLQRPIKVDRSPVSEFNAAIAHLRRAEAARSARTQPGPQR